MNAVAGPNPIEFLLLMLLGGGFGVPSVMPPTEEDPLAAKVAPAECLFYASWAGTGTPDATSGNHTEQMLAEPEVQEFLTQGRRQLFDIMRQPWALDPKAEHALQDMSELLELVQGKPGAVFLTELSFDESGPPTIKGAGLLRVNDDAAAVQEVLDRIQGRAQVGEVTTVQIGARTFSRVQLEEDAQTITWGVAGKYLLVAFGEGSLEGLMQRAAGQPPAWLNDARAKLSVPRVSSTMYIDVKRLVEMVVQESGAPEAGRVVSMLGLDKVGSFANVSGMDDKGCVSRSLLTVDEGGTGLSSWIDAKPLAADDLKVIGHDATVAIAFKLDASGLLDLVLDVLGQTEPREAEQIREGLAQAQQQLGITFREDLLKSLGDTWRIFTQPGPNSLVGGWTIAIQVRDRQKLERVQEILVTMAKAGLEQAGQGVPSLTADTVNGHAVHTLEFGQPGIPVAPSWCLTDDELFIAATPETLKPLLSGDGSGQSLAEHPDVANLFAGNERTLVLAYMDTRVVAETIVPLAPRLLQSLGPIATLLDTSNLPPADAIVSHLQPAVFAVERTTDGVALVNHRTLPGANIGASLPVAVAVALPGIGAERQAARRTQSTINLKNIALGLQNFHDTYKAFPAGYNADKDGKPLLSWRVHILPFVEGADLYDQFHLDEPWDSPHNKKLIEQMPQVYRSPESKANSGMTNYLGVGGADGVFVRPRPEDKPRDKIGTRIAQITDGTSNTVVVVEVPDDSAVIWTKPGDFAPDKENPMRGLVGLRPGGFLAAFVDGSVQFIAESIGADVNGLFTKSGGERVRLP